MTIALLIWLAAFVAKLWRDVWLYRNGKRNRHTIGPALVVVAIAAATYFGGWITLPLWGFGWWALFDPAYALSIGKHPSFLGTTAKLDRLQRKYPFLVYLKYALFIASIIFYVMAS